MKMKKILKINKKDCGKRSSERYGIDKNSVNIKRDSLNLLISFKLLDYIGEEIEERFYSLRNLKISRVI